MNYHRHLRSGTSGMSSFAIVSLSVLVSLCISTTEAFVAVAPSGVAITSISTTHKHSSKNVRATTRLFDVSAQEALEQTKRRLEEMQQQQQQPKRNSSIDPRIDERVREYLSFPANELKRELKSNGLPTKGRKPDLAKRLAEFEYLDENPNEFFGDSIKDSDDSDPARTKYLDPKGDANADTKVSTDGSQQQHPVLDTFGGIPLSETAGKALGKARFDVPTPIQRKALPSLFKGQSAVLHAETGSGKTLAYILPITEALWKDEMGEYGDEEDTELYYGFILTPTRELASQVAGVASALAPPGSVRLVTKPTNLLSEGRYWKERRGDRVDDPDFLEEETNMRGRGSPPRLFVGSAKAIQGSLYGDGRMPASPTRKPAAKELLAKTRWVVLDEVDRLLNVKTKKGISTAQRNQRAKKSNRYGNGEYGEHDRKSSQQTGPLHEKPAAILTAAIARRTLGRAQVIAASATVGRGLKRELSRVLGLPPKEYPRVIRGDAWDTNSDSNIDSDGYDIDDEDDDNDSLNPNHVDRAVTIPGSVRNYVLSVDASSSGKLLTSAFFAIKNLNSKNNKNDSDSDSDNKKSSEKILLVLTKGCGITTTNAIGALKHFQCKPEPKSLLDVLQDANGTDQLMDVHNRVAGSDGIGESGVDTSINSDDDGYVLVTGEDTVRGMHLAGLDTVVVVGRANGPDEYIHIAGRTGRAGNPGKVINVLSEPHALAIASWETMLSTKFESVTMEDIAGLE
jgi:superfamily II DNA/RNA helicase